MRVRIVGYFGLLGNWISLFKQQASQTNQISFHCLQCVLKPKFNRMQFKMIFVLIQCLFKIPRNTFS